MSLENTIAKAVAAAVLEELRPMLAALQSPPKPAAQDRLLRLPEVLAIVGVKPTTWHQGVKDKRFPAPIKLGRASAWRLSDIENLMAAKNEKPAG